MYSMILKISEKSLNPDLFLIGLGLMYATGFILILAVAYKFIEYVRSSTRVKTVRVHYFSTLEMSLSVLGLFVFWLNSIGQISLGKDEEYIFFSLGSIFVIFSTIWHLWAKVNIGKMWSDDIEIKSGHLMISCGAFGISRHPMYASILLWCWGGSLLMFNYATLILVTFVFLPLMFKRAKAEETELLREDPEYFLFQKNVRMLTPSLRGVFAFFIKLAAILLFGYSLYSGMTVGKMILLLFMNLFLGYSLYPEKVAFSYRSKSMMMIIFYGLSFLWYPFIYFLYVLLAMFIYGLRYNCPCMLVYDKYQRCPCFSLLEKAICLKKK